MPPTHRVISLWRFERGFSQAQLAELSGIPRPNLSLIEQGARDLTLSTLRRLAAALGVTPGTLADGIPPQAHAKWSRESLDRMAKYLADQDVSLSEEEKNAAELLRPLVRQKLSLNKVSVFRAATPRRGRREQNKNLALLPMKFEPAEIKSLLNRIDKLLGVRP